MDQAEFTNWWNKTDQEQRQELENSIKQSVDELCKDATKAKLVVIEGHLKGLVAQYAKL